ncbi:hypothetical protein QCA50_010773 [Cerrena zonata]|uniref:Uncharacterized protein n=1 Tax=Cerrena zonata TaxID=2478898 RepID=A0AAW0FY24_9APHY
MAAARKDPPGDDTAGASKKRRTSDRLSTALSSTGDPATVGDSISDSLEESAPGVVGLPNVPAAVPAAVQGPAIPAAESGKSSQTAKALVPSSERNVDEVAEGVGQGLEMFASMHTPPSTPRKDKGKSTLASPFALRSTSNSPGSPSGPASMVAGASELQVRVPRQVPYGVRHYVSDEVVDRINRAIAYRHNKPITYAASAFPKTFQWGPPSVKGREDVADTEDLSNYVTQGSQMVRIMVIGELCSAFLTGNSNNGGTASIRVKPLLLSDGLRMDDLVKGFSTSSRARLGESNTKGTYMSSKVGEGAVFARIFDARDGFVGKKLMPVLKAGEVRNRDLVYAEAYVQRYWFKSDGKCKYLSDHEGCLDWAKTPYRIGLELVAISLIASHHADDEEEDEPPTGM